MESFFGDDPNTQKWRLRRALLKDSSKVFFLISRRRFCLQKNKAKLH